MLVMMRYDCKFCARRDVTIANARARRDVIVNACARRDVIAGACARRGVIAYACARHDVIAYACARHDVTSDKFERPRNSAKQREAVQFVLWAAA